jgi:choline dehydrogenase-like flavoprotein
MATRQPRIESPVMTKDELLTKATTAASTPFDYIIVGSGAGGGPLACRLAQAHKRVLLIEAGADPAKMNSLNYPDAEAGEVHDVPGYMAAASEDKEMSWQFSVRHYEDNDRQQLDQKYDETRDTDGTGGIFYPRSSGLGGCTGHHAMIIVRPNNKDWDRIADLTNDDSWSASNMQPLFAKLENCLYLNEFRGFLPRILDGLFFIWRAIVTFFTPRAVLDEGGHGTEGWQPTSLISPKLIRRILNTDPLFSKVLLRSAFATIEQSNRLLAWLKQLIVTFGVVRQFDINDNLTRKRSSRGGIFLIPMGTGGESELKDENGRPLKGRRAGLREFLLTTQRDFPEFLVIVSEVHVTQVLFENGQPQLQDRLVDSAHFDEQRLRTPLRATGVKGVCGKHLYRASPLWKQDDSSDRTIEYFAKREVILCGGTFNTPQLLMLSGIGDREQLQKFDIPCRAHLPGVGKNLQDRYEVGVVSELKSDLVTLNGVTYQPGDPEDPERKLWIEKKEGIYAINGGTIVVLQRSKQADGPEPDLFAFGVPGAFRGYYWNWSREIFRPIKGAPFDQHNLWTWVILKAYTRNNNGRVRLRSNCPFDTPGITFHSFDEGKVKDWEKDVEALEEAVESLRRINQFSGTIFGDEVQPARFLAEQNSHRRAQNQSEFTLKDWIKNEAWGHHACGTCRIGSDAWCEDTSKLKDTNAVLDSEFRVHGVRGLRVVDASIFPEIPGYFILAPIFMVSEKAALTILKESNDENYPEPIREIEHAAVSRRRKAALLPANLGDLTGLALSGGGIRSAAFNLGLLQGLAQKDKLRKIDYLSTVSGGAFIGGFLGRLFHGPRVTKSADPCGRAQDILQSNQSVSIKWLRDNSNYLFAAGVTDWYYAAGIFFRNTLAVYLVLGILLIAIFGGLAGISQLPWIAPLLPRIETLPEVQELMGTGSWTKYLSVWWWLPIAMLVFVVVPMSFAFWLAPKSDSNRPVPPFSFAAWVVLVIAACVACGWTDKDFIPGAALVSLITTWVWLELARSTVRKSGDDSRPNSDELIQNCLSRGLGSSLFIFVALTGWVAIDSVARMALGNSLLIHAIKTLTAAIPILMILQSWGQKLLKLSLGLINLSIIRISGVLVAVAFLIVLDMIALRLFQEDTALPWVIVALALVFSIVAGRALGFLNSSSWHSAYAARIRRCFLGAANEARFEDEHRILTDVQIADPDDDIPQHLYRPEDHGGPLHLISVCINDTVEYASDRTISSRRGTLMTIGTFGISVGRRYFARWTNSIVPPFWLRIRRWIDGMDSNGDQSPALQPLALDSDPNTFHPFGRRDGRTAVVESLSLGRWIAVSGAAYSTGRGRATNPLDSLVLGLANIRLGYWWCSGIKADERSGRFPANFWRRLKEFPFGFFRTQQLLLSEWFGKFNGPSRQFWNLTDGGHVDATSLYELVRRRLPLIISSDATQDMGYVLAEFSNLVRMIRVDFGAELKWEIPNPLPEILASWINPDQCGMLNEIRGNSAHGGPGKKHAAIAQIIYPDGTISYLIYIKPSLTGLESIDLISTAATDTEFPQDPTADQLFDERLWESYRRLGFEISQRVFK